jgi:integrase
MPSRFRFTKASVDALKPTSTRATYYDNSVEKLAVLVSPAGRKTFNVIRWTDGKMVWLKLGTFPEMTVEQARAEAQKALGEFATGSNPAEVKKARIAANAAVLIKALEAWNAYVQSRSPKWSESHKQDHAKVSATGGELRTRGKRPNESDKTQAGILMPLLKLPLNKIDNPRVEAWLKAEVIKRPTHARLAYTLLRAFINWCSETTEYKDQTNSDACSSKRIRSALPKKKAKTDCLSREQLKAWFKEVKNLPNPKISAYIQILLLVGARRTELAALKWEDVDLKWCSMTLKDKVEGARTIPVTPYVAQLLTEIQTLNNTPPPEHRILNGKRIKNDPANWKPSPYVFSSSTAKSGYLQDPSAALDRACQAAGVPSVTLHGLRRSFASLSEWVECPAGISAQIQGHKPSATREKHYIVRPLDLLRMWHTRIEAWVLNQAGIKQPEAQSEKPKAKLKAVK